MPIQTLAIFFLVAAAFGGVAYVFLYSILSGEKRAESRRLGITQNDSVARKAAARAGAPKVRREQIESTLKELDDKRKKANSPPLQARIAQAGLSWEKRTFFIFSGGLALVV